MFENRYNQSHTSGWEVIDATQCYGGPTIALWSGSLGWHYLTKCKEENRENPESVLM